MVSGAAPTQELAGAARTRETTEGRCDMMQGLFFG